MAKILIDDREIEVPAGTTVIEAAEQLGIVIPRFCYHPALGSVGACRVCAVKFLEGPFRGVQMSCMIEARDGMVVSTTDPEAVDFRRHVIEWLMLNHPHDCPVCDEGGHCLLQDMTVAGGHSRRRYQGEKRTYYDQYLGPLLQHEMNRCIHCYRCSRFYQEFAGYHDLGTLGSGQRTYFGRFEDGRLESPFAGNLSDICPTGVFTDRPSRFVGRRWDYQRTPSLCLNCSLGCHLVVSCRYREVMRLEARFSERVNGYFICDRGRYGFYYASRPDRPRRARISGREVSREKALDFARETLKRLGQEAGSDSIACLGSARNDLRSQAMLKLLCQEQGWGLPAYFADDRQARKAEAAVKRLEAGLAVSMRELESADFLLLLGADPINEAPMLALALRQAWRKGACVAVADPRPISLPFDFEHLAVSPDQIEATAEWLVRGAVSRTSAMKLEEAAGRFHQHLEAEGELPPGESPGWRKMLQALRASRRPVIVCGCELVRGSTVERAADYALLLQAEGKQAGLFYLLPGANGFGAGLLSSERACFGRSLAAMEQGRVRALILVEADPFKNFPERQRLERALKKLDLLIVLDYLDSAVARRADIFLPTATIYEAGGLFINQEGRLQAAAPCCAGGIPLSQLSQGGHPPRRFRRDAPEARVAWETVADLVAARHEDNRHRELAKLWQWLATENELFRQLPPTEKVPEEGQRLTLPKRSAGRFGSIQSEARETPADQAEDLELVVVDWTFGTEELSGYSEPIRKLEKAPCLWLSAETARSLNLSNGDRVRLHLDGGVLESAVSVAANMAPQVAVLPRHRRFEWQKFKSLPAALRFEQIEKIEPREE